MNRIVDAWNASEKRKQYTGPDSVVIDGENRTLSDSNQSDRHEEGDDKDDREKAPEKH